MICTAEGLHKRTLFFAIQLVCSIVFLASAAAAQSNMITNGDFESGVTGFTSDYSNYTGQINRTGCSLTSGYGNPCTIEAGQYAIGTDADEYDVPYFITLGDHTSGSGNYLIVDAGDDDTKSPWISGQTINVTSTSQTYKFDAWIANVNDAGATVSPELYFEIGDGTNWVEIGTTGAIANGSGWVNVSQVMTFTGTGLFFVRLRNAATGLDGNDFGLDDVAFTACSGCTATQEVNLGSLDTIPILASSTPSDDATGVSISDNIVLTFSEAVDAETGNLVLYNSSNDVVETFDVASSGLITGSGTTTITINPTSNLAYSTGYYVQIASTAFDDAAGNSYAGITDATTLSFTTAAAPTPPAPPADTTRPTVTLSTTANATANAAFEVTATFSEVVTGFVQGDITITGGTITALTGSDDSYTASVTPTADEIVKISVVAGVATDAAGNDNTASNELVIAPSTPALEFAKHEAEIRQTIVSDAQRNLRSTIGSARNLTSNARQRFIAATTEQTDCTEYPQEDVEQREDVLCGQKSIPFDVDGTAQYSAGVASSAGTFLEVRESEDGNHRRLLFGDFNIQRDADASVTATLNAKIAWEQMLSEQTLYGYFIGGQFAQSDIEGTLTGDNQRVGLEAGAYAVHQLGEALYFDGFASLGLSNNTLELADDVLTLNSDYLTKTFALGAALSGIVTKDTYELRPELAFNFGKAWIGDVGFTGTAYGMTDDTLSLDAGNVTLASLTFRPEVVMPLDGRNPNNSNTEFSFSPRFVCEHIKAITSSNYCGAGAELGFSSVSKSGLSTADIKLIMDRIDNGTRSSVQFGLEHRF